MSRYEGPSRLGSLFFLIVVLALLLLSSLVKQEYQLYTIELETDENTE